MKILTTILLSLSSLSLFGAQIGGPYSPVATGGGSGSNNVNIGAGTGIVIGTNNPGQSYSIGVSPNLAKWNALNTNALSFDGITGSGYDSNTNLVVTNIWGIVITNTPSGSQIRPGSLTALGGVVVAENTNAVITISSRGVKNGLSAFTNAGSLFGPDTPGTTTCGIQEAFNSMPNGTEYGPTATGIQLRFGEGYFYYTNLLCFSNNFTYSLTMEGASMLSTKLVYAGTTDYTNCVWVTGYNPYFGSYSSGSYSPVHFEARNIGFSSISNLHNALLTVDHYAYLSVDNCNFESWQLMQNTTVGSGMSIGDATGSPSMFPNLVGFVCNGGGDHLTALRNVFFANVADGVLLNCDHQSVINIKSAFVGEKLNGGAGIPGTGWANSSLYSIGAVILQYAPLDAVFIQPHFYASNVGLAMLTYFGGNAGSAGTTVIINPNYDGESHPFLFDDTTDLSYQTLTVVGVSGTYTPGDNLKLVGNYPFSNYSNTATPTGDPVPGVVAIPGGISQSPFTGRVGTTPNQLCITNGIIVKVQ